MALPTKAAQAQELLRKLLADGEWHSSREVHHAVNALVPGGVDGKIIQHSLYAIGGDAVSRRRAGSKWRLLPDATPRGKRTYPKGTPLGAAISAGIRASQAKKKEAAGG
jgi:hypothetical protein